MRTTIPPSSAAHEARYRIDVTTIAETVTLTQIVELHRTGSSDEERHDADLADHVRSALGPLVKDLDLPRVHVMAEGTRVLLHGDVASPGDAATIESAVAALASVDSVESHLHVGLLAGDTRPSQSPPPRSAMFDALFAAAERVKVDDDSIVYALHGALAAILDVIPVNERSQVIEHFPDDVKELAVARRRLGETFHGRSVLDIEIATSLRGGIPLAKARRLVPAVIGVIRTFVPEEDLDVQATLSTNLRQYWKHQRRRPNAAARTS